MRRALTPVFLAAQLAACVDLHGVRDMLALQQGLARELQFGAISINVNSQNSMTVVFQNSTFASLPDSQRAAFAHGVALYVRDHYPEYSQLQSIGVGFSSRSAVGPLSYTQSEVPYHYSVSDLGAAPDSVPTRH